jgi:RNA polymerase sigma-70 factor (ECF subfamily)
MCNAGERAMADDRQEWFLKQIFNHGAALHRYLRRFTSGAEDVEDLVQETYVRIFALADSKGIVSPRALLFRVAHNLAVERARRRIGRATDSVADFELLGVSTVDPSPEEQIDARRRFESFCAAVDLLPPLCRRVFVLRKVYKLSHAEIAEILNVSHSTIEKHVAKGLLRCRGYLKDQGMLESFDMGTAETRRRGRDGRDLG